MKTMLIVTAALALTSPLAFAKDKQPAQAAANTTETRETRDWAAIDSNGDKLISPEEMQKYLEATWAAKKK